MNNYREIIRQELAVNSNNKQAHVKRDFSRYTSKSSSAWNEATDVETDYEANFWSDCDEDNEEACFFVDDIEECGFFN